MLAEAQIIRASFETGLILGQLHFASLFLLIDPDDIEWDSVPRTPYQIPARTFRSLLRTARVILSGLGSEISGSFNEELSALGDEFEKACNEFPSSPGAQGWRGLIYDELRSQQEQPNPTPQESVMTPDNTWLIEEELETICDDIEPPGLIMEIDSQDELTIYLAMAYNLKVPSPSFDLIEKARDCLFEAVKYLSSAPQKLFYLGFNIGIMERDSLGFSALAWNRIIGIRDGAKALLTEEGQAQVAQLFHWVDEDRKSRLQLNRSCFLRDMRKLCRLISGSFDAEPEPSDGITKTGSYVPCPSFVKLNRYPPLPEDEAESFEYFLGCSEVSRRVMAAATNFAKSNEPILIIGSAGSGKEMLARDIHRMRIRGGEDDRFLVVKPTPSRPEDCLSELFGVDKNVYTGVGHMHGKLHQAGTGTVLLDDLQRWPFDQQAILHRPIENREYEPRPKSPTGEPSQFEGQLILTFNEDIEVAVGTGRLMADLLDRLRARTIWIPPLSHPDRRIDIPHLCRRFIKKRREGSQIEGPTPFESTQDNDIISLMQSLVSKSTRYMEDELGMCFDTWLRDGQGRQPFDLKYVQSWLTGEPSFDEDDSNARRRILGVLEQSPSVSEAVRRLYKEEIQRAVDVNGEDRKTVEERYRGVFRRRSKRLGISIAKNDPIQAEADQCGTP
jgi:hypothetical protein